MTTGMRDQDLGYVLAVGGGHHPPDVSVTFESGNACLLGSSCAVKENDQRDFAFRLLDWVIEQGLLVHIRVRVLDCLGKGHNFQTVVCRLAKVAVPLGELSPSLGPLFFAHLSVTIGADSLQHPGPHRRLIGLAGFVARIVSHALANR